MQKHEDALIEQRLRSLKTANSYTLKFLTKGLSNEDTSTAPIAGRDAINLMQSWLDELDATFDYNHLGLTIKELAFDSNVSDRTIRTWMSVGLVSRMNRVDNVSYRVFTPENVNGFIANNKVRINRARKKKQVSPASALKIAHQYRSLYNSGLNKSQCIKIISKELDISDRTIEKLVPDDIINKELIVKESKHYPQELIAEKHKISVAEVTQIIYQSELYYIESFDLNYLDIECNSLNLDVSIEITDDKVKFTKDQEINAFCVYNHLKKTASKAKEHDTVLEILAQIQKVKNEIMQSVLPMISDAADKFKEKFPYSDKDCLISEGSSIAVTAMDTFDPSLGRFSTYLYTSVNRDWLKSLNKTSREITNCDLSREVDLKTEVPDVSEYLNCLSDTERFVAVSKFGIGDAEPMTDREIAASLDSSIVHVESVWNYIIQKMRGLND